MVLPLVEWCDGEIMRTEIMRNFDLIEIQND